LPELIARSDHDFDVPVRPRRQKSAGVARSAETRANVVWRLVRKYPGATFGAAAACALGVGILVNALILQTQRHPAPLFAGKSPATVEAQTAPVQTQAATAPQVPADALAPQPVRRPANLSAPAIERPMAEKPAPALVQRAAAPEAGRGDAIAALLRANNAAQAGGEANRTVLGAQRALVKLGFVLKPDGVMGGTTRQAIERFERDRNLPVRGDLTPKIIKMLAAESGVAID
jgi:hypothetical protein